MNTLSMFIKRIFDFLVADASMVILWPLFIIIALIIKCSSKGPFFFTQKRVGKQGKLFTCIKFRTMYIDSEQYGSITTSSDKRITPIGKILRKLKLDELPQFWNVFIGKMSFVGPRPDVEGYADKLKGNNRKILELRPGITGPASIFFRDEERLLASVDNPKDYNDRVIWPTKVKINMIYIEQWSFWKDIGYILITLFPVLDDIFGLMKQYKKL